MYYLKNIKDNYYVVSVGNSGKIVGHKYISKVKGTPSDKIEDLDTMKRMIAQSHQYLNNETKRPECENYEIVFNDGKTESRIKRNLTV